ncbi:MAG: DUF4266 domain-containing protein [Myxococcales bacterium]|nr:DUF4266 domain-containing protein [Myxococcales bacterium]MCB9646906.1 DUF4266 domain-containing protein [Deltaproteobacteria bacterium]
MNRHVRALAALALLLCAGCAPTRFYERERLAHRCMQMDVDGRVVYIRNKMEAAREGAFGGFGGAAAGSCGCQ